MKSITAWIKSNPLNLIAIGVTLVSLIVILWVYYSSGSFVDDVKTAYDRTVRDVSSLENRTIEIASDNPYEPPIERKGVVINLATLNVLKGMNESLTREAKQAFAAAVDFNKREPITSSFTAEIRSFQRDSLRDDFLDAYQAMLTDRGLNAGQPPSREELQAVIDRVRSQFRDEIGARTAPTPEQIQELRKRTLDAVRNVIYERASGIDIYARTQIDADTPSGPSSTFSGAEDDVSGRPPTTAAAEFPFELPRWVTDPGYAAELKLNELLWESQMELWIQSDIARAIAAANTARDATLGDTSGSQKGVLGNPVKRLISIDVIDGYIGLQSPGGVQFVGRGDVGTSSSPMTNLNGGYLPPPGNKMFTDVEGLQSLNFYIAPTGRVSNALYDVRHARLVVIVDAAQLHKLLNALTTQNFITVVGLNLNRVDPVEEARLGYDYGLATPYRAELLLESLWLRDWTKGLMPDKVKQAVGLEPAPPQVGGTPAQPTAPPAAGVAY